MSRNDLALTVIRRAHAECGPIAPSSGTEPRTSTTYITMKNEAVNTINLVIL